MKTKKTFIKELSSTPKSGGNEPTFGWNKSVVPVRPAESGNMHRRSTMQTTAPKSKTNIAEEHASVRAKRK